MTLVQTIEKLKSFKGLQLNKKLQKSLIALFLRAEKWLKSHAHYNCEHDMEASIIHTRWCVIHHLTQTILRSQLTLQFQFDENEVNN